MRQTASASTTVAKSSKVCCKKRCVALLGLDPCDEWPGIADGLQRLMGASLLVFKNKSDVAGSMSEDEVRDVEAS